MKNDFEGINNLFYLPVCHSTNDWAYEMIKNGTCLPDTVFITDYQTHGRGQQGAVWESHPGENLTFSYVILPQNWKQDELVALNWAVPLAIIETLSNQGIPATIKWPNDIFIEQRKLGGILIETGWKGPFVGHIIVGIGLNVNQMIFRNDKATSIKYFTSTEGNRGKWLIQIIERLQSKIRSIENRNFGDFKNDFEAKMYGVNQELWFETDTKWQGMIKGVDAMGRLEITKGNETMTFSNKEVRFVF